METYIKWRGQSHASGYLECNVMDGIPRKVIQLISLKLETSKKHPGVDIHLWFIRHPRAIVLEERLGHIFNPNLL